MLPLTSPNNNGVPIQRKPVEEQQSMNPTNNGNFGHHDIEHGGGTTHYHMSSNNSARHKSSNFKNIFSKRPKTIIFIILLLSLLLIVWFINTNGRESTVSILPKVSENHPFHWYAYLLTNPNQKSEASYGWYQEQLDNSNLLGRSRFKDSIMTRFGFQNTYVTDKNWFYYFRTFNVREQCPRQHSCQVYPTKAAGDVIKEGINLDAVLHHNLYQAPFFLDPLEKQQKNVENFQKAISVTSKIMSESTALEYSTLIDKSYGEEIWRGMRRLTLYMCSEAYVDENIAPLIQKPGDVESMKRFSQSTADISVCFQRSCSVWVNYLYYNIEYMKSNLKPLSKKKGICAFISNCEKGTIARARYEMLKKLSDYVPIRQYGACGNNAKEGPGGKQFELENNCRFYFAAENSIVKDYVTEKFFEGVKAVQGGAKLLMIYKGAPNIKDFGFPSSMYINADDFETVEELGEYLQKLDSDKAFESRFAEITEQDREKIDLSVSRMEARLGGNIPCRLCKAIGQMKLARYLLFKIGLNPANNKVNQLEWDEFKQRFASLGKDRLQILDQIYYMAFSIFYKEGNYQNLYNLGWPF